MPIPLTHMQERLSVAYVSAVVAAAGAQLVNPSSTEYGVDAYVQEVKKLPSGAFHPTGFLFMCQIKATTLSVMREHDIAYDMKVGADARAALHERLFPDLQISMLFQQL